MNGGLSLLGPDAIAQGYLIQNVRCNGKVNSLHKKLGGETLHLL